MHLTSLWALLITFHVPNRSALSQKMAKNLTKAKVKEINRRLKWLLDKRYLGQTLAPFLSVACTTATIATWQYVLSLATSYLTVCSTLTAQTSTSTSKSHTTTKNSCLETWGITSTFHQNCLLQTFSCQETATKSVVKQSSKTKWN